MIFQTDFLTRSSQETKEVIEKMKEFLTNNGWKLFSSQQGEQQGEITLVRYSHEAGSLLIALASVLTFFFCFLIPVKCNFSITSLVVSICFFLLGLFLLIVAFKRLPLRDKKETINLFVSSKGVRIRLLTPYDGSALNLDLVEDLVKTAIKAQAGTATVASSVTVAQA